MHRFRPKAEKFGDLVVLIVWVNRILLLHKILGTKWKHERCLASYTEFNRQTPNRCLSGNRKNLRNVNSIRVSLTMLVVWRQIFLKCARNLVIIIDRQGTLTRHIIQTQGLIREKTIWKILEKFIPIVSSSIKTRLDYDRVSSSRFKGSYNVSKLRITWSKRHHEGAASIETLPPAFIQLTQQKKCAVFHWFLSSFYQFLGEIWSFAG